MNWVHPWRGIVQNHPKEGTENKNDQRNLEHAMEDMIPLVTLNIIQDGANREDDNQPERPQEWIQQFKTYPTFFRAYFGFWLKLMFNPIENFILTNQGQI